MLQLSCYILILVTVCSSNRVKEYHPKRQEQKVEASNSFDNKIDTGHHVTGLLHPTSSDVGHSSGAELGSIAHNSAVQADRAVQTQQTAGSQAAFGIKSTLAGAALGAAQAAQAAVVGKQAIVGNLKRQLTEAQQQLQGELALYQQSEATSQAARNTARQSQAQLATLTAALAAAQAGAQHANQAASEAANSNAAQHSMIVTAKQRVDQLLSLLQGATGELQETEASARKALESAKQAQANAVAAGQAVNGSGKQSIPLSHPF
ncbi:uncharacterized protein [Leptinotarsa decemlineata]|uniref:uncharacterized protein n=1 Tax=Leptinotarsa decemlineata TaxID=7539 RepID=UPI003D30790C